MKRSPSRRIHLAPRQPTLWLAIPSRLGFGELECEHNLNTTMAYNNGSSSAPGLVAHSIDELFLCMWVVECGLRCNELIRGHDTSKHLRNCHGIKGADDLRVSCCWQGCNMVLNKEGLTRHVQGAHLKILYPCDTCNKMFTRTHNLDVHKRTCSTPQ